MPRPEDLRGIDKKTLDQELRNPHLFAIEPLGKKRSPLGLPVFLREQRLAQLLSDPATSGEVLNAAANNAMRLEARTNLVQFDEARLPATLHALELVGENPELSSRVDALTVLTNIVQGRDYGLEFNGAMADGKIDRLLITQVGQVARRLAHFPAETSSPQHFAVLADTLSNKFPRSKRGQKINLVLDVLSQLARAEFVEQYYPQPDAFDQENFRVDSIHYLKDKAAVLGFSTSIEASSMKKEKTAAPLIREIILSDTFPEDVDEVEYIRAMTDTTHPRHDEAVRLVRKSLLAYDPNHYYRLLWRLNLSPVDNLRTLPFNEYRRFVIAPGVEQRLAAISKIIGSIRGERGRKDFEELCLRFKNSLLLGHADSLANYNPTSDCLPNVQLGEGEHRGKKSLEVKFVYGQDNFPADSWVVPELAAEHQRAIEEFNSLLQTDIVDSTIALQPLTIECRLPGVAEALQLNLQPIPDRFPACSLRVQGADMKLETSLDEQLQLTPPVATGQPHYTSFNLLRSFAIAALHDTLTLNTITTRISGAAEPTSPAKPSSEAVDSTDDSTKADQSQRVRKSKNLVVLMTNPDTAPTTDVHITEVAMDEANSRPQIEVTVDARAHWADLAPQLTQVARERTLTEIEQSGLIKSTENNAVVLQFLQHIIAVPENHRLSVNQLFAKLMNLAQAGHHLNLRDFPLMQVRERWENLERQYYVEALNNYVPKELPATLPDGTPLMTHDALQSHSKQPAGGRLPNISKMTTRMKRDTLAQTAGAVIPPRLRETQTYIPHKRYQHRIDASKPIMTVGDHYKIIRGKTAVEALTTLIEEAYRP